MYDAFVDACLDSLKLLPFLFVTYLFMEWLEHGAGKQFERVVARAGRIGPVVGALLGVVPQCGFSGAAATLYAGRVITLGTLIAVFMATSDEMLPIMISEAYDPVTIAKVLAIKVVAGMCCGLVLDVVLQRTGRLHAGLSSLRKHSGHGDNDIHELCEQEGCECDDDAQQTLGAQVRLDDAVVPTTSDSAQIDHGHDHGHDHDHAHGGIVMPALRHTLNVMVFIFIITLLLNVCMEMGLEGALGSVTGIPYVSAILAGLFGFIPNCATSVAITELYMEGLLSGGALVCGLCVNAGIGLLVLFRTNRDIAENLKIMAVMFAMSLVAGFIVQAAGLL